MRHALCHVIVVGVSTISRELIPEDPDNATITRAPRSIGERVKGICFVSRLRTRDSAFNEHGMYLQLDIELLLQGQQTEVRE